MSCDCFSDPRHPKRKTSIALKIFLLLMMVIGILIVVSAIYHFSLLSLIFGLSIVGFCFVGLFASGYHEGQESALCLRIFWVSVLIISASLILLGSIMVAAANSILSNLKPKEECDMGWTCVDFSGVGAMLLLLLGVPLLIAGLVFVFPLLLSSYLLGARLFFNTAGLFGSCVIILLGIVVLFLVSFFYRSMELSKNYTSFLVVILVFGIFLVLLGILGAVGHALQQNFKWPLRIFVVLLIVLLVAFFVLAIIALAVKSIIGNDVLSYCGLESLKENERSPTRIEESRCFPIVEGAMFYLCDGKSDQDPLNPCPGRLKQAGKCNCAEKNKITNLTKSEFYDATLEYTSVITKGDYTVVGVMIFVVVAYLIAMLVVVFISMCCFGSDSVNGGSGGDGNREGRGEVEGSVVA